MIARFFEKRKSVWTSVGRWGRLFSLGEGEGGGARGCRERERRACVWKGGEWWAAPGGPLYVYVCEKNKGGKGGVGWVGVGWGDDKERVGDDGA